MKKGIVFASLLIGVGFLMAQLWPHSSETPAAHSMASILAWPEADSSKGYRMAGPETDMSPADIQALSPEQAEHLLHESFEQIVFEVGRPEFRGAVTQRPHFVSPIEWYVLVLQAEHQASESDQAQVKLDSLVNKLRFYKLKGLWESSFKDKQYEDLRLAVAEQLLAEMPNRVKDRHLSQASAFALSEQLIKQTFSDAAEQQHRLEAIAEALGVGYNILGTS